MSRIERSLPVEHDESVTSGDGGLRSIKDADYRHQKAAMMQGYNSLTEMAVDELIVRVRDLEERVSVLEGNE